MILKKSKFAKKKNQQNHQKIRHFDSLVCINNQNNETPLKAQKV